MPDQHVPSVSSRLLGRKLRALREAQKLSCDRAAAALGRDPIWLVHIEVGQDQIALDQLRDLLDVYAVTDEEVRGDLVELAHRAAGPSWLRPHAGRLSELQRDFIILESEASAIRAFGMLLIPELLRTEAYAREIITATRRPGEEGSVEEDLDLLLNRQRHQAEGTPRRLHVVLDESAISQCIGARDTMLGQLRHLIESAKQDEVTVQLIPREVGAHVGLDGAFHILEFPRRSEPSVSISQSALGPLLAYSGLGDHFEKLEQVALSPGESVFMIEQAHDDLFGHSE